MEWCAALGAMAAAFFREWPMMDGGPAPPTGRPEAANACFLGPLHALRLRKKRAVSRRRFALMRPTRGQTGRRCDQHAKTGAQNIRTTPPKMRPAPALSMRSQSRGAKHAAMFSLLSPCFAAIPLSGFRPTRKRARTGMVSKGRLFPLFRSWKSGSKGPRLSRCAARAGARNMPQNLPRCAAIPPSTRAQKGTHRDGFQGTAIPLRRN